MTHRKTMVSEGSGGFSVAGPLVSEKGMDEVTVQRNIQR